MARKKKQKKKQKKKTITVRNRTQTVKLVIEKQQRAPQNADYAVLQSKLRANQSRLRKLESTLANVFENHFLPQAPSVKAIDMNSIGNKAEDFVRYRQQGKEYDANIKMADTLARRIEGLASQEMRLRQRLKNIQSQYKYLQSMNSKRILAARARGNKAAELYIRREHTASVSSLYNNASSIRQNLGDIVSQMSPLHDEYGRISGVLAQTEPAAQQAKRQASLAAQNFLGVTSSMRKQQQQQRKRTITGPRPPPPTKRRLSSSLRD